MTPRSGKSGYGLLLGCRSSLDAGPYGKQIDDVRKMNWPKPGKYSPSVLVRHRNPSGVFDLVGREPLMFAKVENGVTKLCQFFAGKTGKTQSWHEIFRFFEQDRLLCARVDIGVTEYPTKTAKEEEEEKWV